MSSLESFHQLLRSLGSNNSALEKLYIWKDVHDDEDEANNSNTLLTNEQTLSL